MQKVKMLHRPHIATNLQSGHKCYLFMFFKLHILKTLEFDKYFSKYLTNRKYPATIGQKVYLRRF